eukprot:scaffold47138_cov38-Cyclotella_meneghiniana.AAC.3
MPHILKIIFYHLQVATRSHGNYVESLEVAEPIIQHELDLFIELDASDIPVFTVVFISDGKPSDNRPEQKIRRRNLNGSYC